MGQREARLREVYRMWYPGIDASRWQAAKEVAAVVAQQLLKGEPSWELGPRVLSDEHFTFRGGYSRPGRGRTRLEDKAETS